GSDCLRRPGRRREGGSAAPEPQSRDGKRMKEHATGARRSLSTFALLTLTTMTGAAWAQATPADVPPVPPPPAAEMAAPPSVPPQPAGGKVHKNVGVTLNLNANMLSWNGAGVPSAGSLVALEDAIISFDFYDEF